VIELDNKTLRKVQLVQLEIAKEVDRVSAENGIKCFLIGGTLLGAIRHKGFIPWDDDLDIGMLRNDYEKFAIIAAASLNEKYKFIDWKSDSNYPHPMGKVIKKGTIYKESKRNDLGEQGIWVDIFPYDNICMKPRRTFFKLKVIRSLIRAKCNYQTWHSNRGIILMKYIKNLPFRIIAPFFDKNYLIDAYEKISVGESEETVYENGTENYNDWCFKKDYFTTFKKVQFEDYYFWAPEQYDEYLKIAYGNYMELPPVEERENKHLIVSIDFGEKEN
jgi:lipopolysaccharide cholinephosphotransferase